MPWNLWVRDTLVVNALLKRILLLKVVPEVFKLLSRNLDTRHLWLVVLFVTLLLVGCNHVALIPSLGYLTGGVEAAHAHI